MVTIRTHRFYWLLARPLSRIIAFYLFIIPSPEYERKTQPVGAHLPILHVYNHLFVGVIAQVGALTALLAPELAGENTVVCAIQCAIKGQPLFVQSTPWTSGGRC